MMYELEILKSLNVSQWDNQTYSVIGKLKA